MSPPSTKSQVAGAADVRRGLLTKVESGELEAHGRRGAAIVGRLESAILGLEVAAGVPAAVGYEGGSMNLSQRRPISSNDEITASPSEPTEV